MGRKMTRFLLIIFLAIIFPDSPDPKVNGLTITPDRYDLIPGEHIKLTVDFDIAPGSYIYSTDPEKSLSPTEIIWSDTTIFIDSSPFIEPIPDTKYDENFEQFYNVGNDFELGENSAKNNKPDKTRPRRHSTSKIF